MELLVGSVAFWLLINTAIGALIGKRKNRQAAGALFGFLLGPIGWLVVGLGPNLGRKCPSCAEIVQAAAKVCRHCQRELPSDA